MRGHVDGLWLLETEVLWSDGMHGELWLLGGGDVDTGSIMEKYYIH